MKISVLLLTLLIFPLTIYSQSSHYWTQQYGTRSMLLSGSVIGGVQDLGAVYYNPARLGFIENPAFILSADVYQWSMLKFKNALGDNINFNKSEFDGVPSLAAGTFKLKFLPNHHFAYAILSRQKTNLNFNYREQTNENVIDNWPGDELFEGQVGLDAKNQEDWFGGSWSHALNDHISLGASGFFVIKENKRGTAIELRALTEDNKVAVYNFNRNFDYETYSLIWKFAAAFQLNKVDLGLTITTPALNLKEDGNFNYQLYYSGIEGDTTRIEIYANSYQEGLKTKTKSPYAIGLGATLNLERSKIFVSAEYYSKLPTYTIFNAADFSMQSKPDSVISFRLIEGANQVLNAGIGIEWIFSQKVSAYVSFSTDFSAALNNTTSFLQNKSIINNNTIKADYYNFGAGVVLAFKGADITLGATHTGSSQDIPRPINFPDDDNEADNLLDPTQTAKLIWSRWRFVVSFSVPFLKEYAEEKWEKFEEKKKNK